MTRLFDCSTFEEHEWKYVGDHDGDAKAPMRWDMLFEKPLACERRAQVMANDLFMAKKMIKDGMNIKMEPAPKIPVAKKIWTNPGDGSSMYTTVQWDDGTKTTVCGEGGVYYGYVCALAKKIHGNQTAIDKAIKAAIDEAELPAKKKAARRAYEKALKQRTHQMRIRKREEKIQEEMEKIRIKKLAAERMMRQGEVEI